jgi:hypothetical protein
MKLAQLLLTVCLLLANAWLTYADPSASCDKTCGVGCMTLTGYGIVTSAKTPNASSRSAFLTVIVAPIPRVMCGTTIAIRL